MKITESKLKQVVAEEVAKYIEEQDLTEAPSELKDIPGVERDEALVAAADECLKALLNAKKKPTPKEKENLLTHLAARLGLSFKRN